MYILVRYYKYTLIASNMFRYNTTHHNKTPLICADK